MNLSGDIAYEINSRRLTPAPLHINGLRSQHSYIHQTGNIRVFGISFYPFGFYPFVHKSLAAIHDEIIDLLDFSTSLARELKYAVDNREITENVIENIEKALCMELQVTDDYINKASLIHDFLEADNDTTIQSFCLKHGIHTKTFMRNILRYTGYTPKILRSIRRFQNAGNQLVYQNPNQLSRVAYDNDFADQAHFIREFRKFTGVPPRIFQQEKITIKENTKYSYL